MYRVLVVEDDLGLQTTLERIMKKAAPDVSLRWVTSASEAIGELESGLADGAPGFDLVLSDLFLPGQELGTSVWNYCKARCPETPFALMSSLETTGFLKMFQKEKNPPPFLPKPFRVSDCRQLVEWLLLGRSSDFFSG